MREHGLADGSMMCCAGIKWFEVDRADVLAAKRAELAAAGATFGPRSGEGCLQA